MAEFIDDMAAEHIQDHGFESDGELSDDISYQGSKRRTTPLSSSGSSSSSSGNESDSQEGMKRKRSSKKKQKRKKVEDKTVLLEIRKTNKLILKLSKMKSHDSRLQATEGQLSAQSTSGMSSSPATPVTPRRSTVKDVPCEVRVSCSWMYM